jgi:hypothetical protein
MGEGSNMSIFRRDIKQLEELEGEIREFVRRDVADLRRHRENAGTAEVDNVSSLVQRVSASSVQEIDEIIRRLEILRERLRDEAARVEREIAGYASLSQAAMQSINVIAESLGLRKGPLTSAAPTKEPRGLPN